MLGPHRARRPDLDRPAARSAIGPRLIPTLELNPIQRQNLTDMPLLDSSIRQQHGRRS